MKKEKNIFMTKEKNISTTPQSVSLGTSTKKTIHELAQTFPEKTYRELERYRDADRQEEAQRIFTQQENEELKEDQLTESQQKQEELEPIESNKELDLFPTIQRIDGLGEDVKLVIERLEHIENDIKELKKEICKA
jgi:hypothetical protein